VRFGDPLGLCPEDDDCIIYWIVICIKCTCISYYVPSVKCPPDVQTTEGEDVSPKYWQCKDSHFNESDQYEEMITPDPVPGNGPRDKPGGVNKLEPDSITATDI